MAGGRGRRNADISLADDAARERDRGAYQEAVLQGSFPRVRVEIRMFDN